MPENALPILTAPEVSFRSVPAEDLESALLRCRCIRNQTIKAVIKDSFKQLAVLMLAKIFDETLPTGERKILDQR